jgi:hypothetical protein
MTPQLDTTPLTVCGAPATLVEQFLVTPRQDVAQTWQVAVAGGCTQYGPVFEMVTEVGSVP